MKQHLSLRFAFTSFLLLTSVSTAMAAPIDGIVPETTRAVSVGGSVVEVQGGTQAAKEATDPRAKAKKNALPASGVLSTSRSQGYENRAVDMPWGTSNGQETAPIAGSVSRAGNDMWKARVFNNSKDIYSANLRVVQLDSRGNRVKSDSFSVRLNPGETSERDLRGSPNSVDAQVNLESWKNLSAQKREKEEATAQKALKDAESSGAAVPTPASRK